MTKKTALFLIMALLFFYLPGCADSQTVYAPQNEKINIAATLFPQYDFARRIAGDRANVTLILPPGSESHTFEPKPGDLTGIYNADLFIYTGDEMEPWAARLLNSADTDTLLVVNVSQGIMSSDGIESGRSDTQSPELAPGGGGHDEPDGHSHALDPHIWLDPTLAVMMIDSINGALCEKYPEYAEFFTLNAESYKAELREFDENAAELIKKAPHDTLVFGGRFAYMYFLRHYGLNYITAYSSCSTESEPSIGEIAAVVDYMKAQNVKYIFHEEFADPKMARSIAEQTGASLLLFSTAHNVTKDELKDGVTFLDIMRRNLENVELALYAETQ